jgi:hypothetical protein
MKMSYLFTEFYIFLINVEPAHSIKQLHVKNHMKMLLYMEAGMQYFILCDHLELGALCTQLCSVEIKRYALFFIGHIFRCLSGYFLHLDKWQSLSLFLSFSHRAVQSVLPVSCPGEQFHVEDTLAMHAQNYDTRVNNLRKFHTFGPYRQRFLVLWLWTEGLVMEAPNRQ